MLHYILQTIAFQLFFLLIYDVFLKKETFFNWNRVYLLMTSLVSLVLPFIEIDRFSQIIPQEYIVNLPQVVIGNLTATEVMPINLENIVVEETSIWSWELLIYAGMAIALTIFLFKMSKLAVMIHKNPKRWKGNLLIVKLIKSSKAFSFFHYIFLGEKIAPQEYGSILQHEEVHVQQRHTLDLLYFEVLRIVFWFNPLVYMYQNRMAELHEFIADAKAVKLQNKGDYYESLLSQVFETQNLSFINPFFKKSLIKKRILMLSKHPSKQKQLLKYALLIPLVFGMLVYTSTNAQEKSLKDLSDKELRAKYTKEIQDMEKQGAIFDDLFENFVDLKDYDNYIQTKEDYYRSKAYSQRFSEGLNTKNAKVAFKSKNHNELQKQTYQEYLEYKKTDEAKINWENSVHSGEIRLLVDDHDNYTPEEEARYKKKMKMLYSDDWFKKLIITDGVTTKVVTKPSENIQLNSNNPIPVSVEDDDFDLEVPFSVIEQVPVYPGCEGMSPEEQKNCMSKEISKYVQKTFNTKLAGDLGLVGRQKISVIFKIDTDGNVFGVRARAPHAELERETIRVISNLPKMKPGIQKGKAVIVPYSLPIIFQVNSDASDVKTTPLIEKVIAMRKQVEIQGNTTDKEQEGFELLLKAVVGTEFDPELVKQVQKYTAIKKKTKLMQKIADVFEQIQIQGNISNEEEETLKGFLILVTDNGLNNSALKEGMKLVEIPYGVIQQVPVYPGCESLPKEEQKKCTTDKIAEHVSKNFNTKLAESLGLEGKIKISTIFKVNRDGNIEGVRARAPHPDLEKEAIRVISNLPKIQPGMHDGKVVTVPYSLPIVFEVKGSAEKDSQKSNDENLLQKSYDEILKMEKQGVNFYELINYIGGDDYLRTREDFFKIKAYMKHLNERIIKMKIEQGEQNPTGIAKLIDKRKTYEEYLEFKKTQKARDFWKNGSKEGVIRLMVGDLKNMTSEEKRRYDAKKEYLDDDKYSFYKFLISDGIKTEVLINKKKEKEFNKRQ